MGIADRLLHALAAQQPHAPSAASSSAYDGLPMIHECDEPWAGVVCIAIYQY
jgi:hypothetical protein